MKTPLKYLKIALCSLLFVQCSKEDTSVNKAPSAFTVSAITMSNSATLNWTAAKDPEGGTISYTVVMDGQTVASKVVTTTYTFADLAYATTFSGKIVAYDDEGLTSETSYTFETEMQPNTAPSAPQLATPSSNEQSVVLTPEFTWTAAADAENDNVFYDVFLDESSNPTTKIVEGITETTFIPSSQLKSNTTYYWKVIARDSSDAFTESAVYSFTTRDLVAAIQVTANAGFAERASFTSVVFNNNMWVVGGATCCGALYEDIWYSNDGENWTEATSSAPFGPRGRHASVVFDDKMWIIGGDKWYSAGNELNDVWYTEDGINWVQATASADFAPRHGPEVVVFDNKMWLFGGDDVNHTINQREVWNSSDGVNWTKVTDNAGINLWTSEFIVFNNKIWRIGAYSDTNIYSTTDGITWTLESENVPFGQRHYHSVTVWDNKIWLMGGSDKATNEFTELPDVWYTEDGTNWKLASENAGFTPTALQAVLTFDNKIWKIAGGGGWQSSAVYNDVWTIGY